MVWRDNVEGWQVDKDMLVEGNKVYSPSTCVFLPNEINSLLLTKLVLNKSGLPKGVIQNSKNSYSVTVSKFNQPCYIGSYPSVEDAEYAYKTAKLEHVNDVVHSYRISGKLPNHVCDAIIERCKD